MVTNMKLKKTNEDRRQSLIEPEELIEIIVDDVVYYCKPVPSFDGYFATTCGSIISTMQKLPRVLKFSRKDKKSEYLRVHLSGTSKQVHRVIASAFLAASVSNCRNEEPRIEVNHIDGDPRNNKVANLEIVSPAENRAWANVLKAAEAERHLAKASVGCTTL
jgi:hypothetical protein